MSENNKREESEFYFGVKFGFRAWQIHRDGILKPLFASTSCWVPGENLATCSKPYDQLTASHYCYAKPPAPCNDESCHCGFNAWNNLADAKDYVNNKPDDEIVFGLIAGAGKMRLHEDGFRCEKAQIIGILNNSGDVNIRSIIAERYNVINFESESDIYKFMKEKNYRDFDFNLNTNKASIVKEIKKLEKMKATARYDGTVKLCAMTQLSKEYAFYGVNDELELKELLQRNINYDLFNQGETKDFVQDIIKNDLEVYEDADSFIKNCITVRLTQIARLNILAIDKAIQEKQEELNSIDF